MLARISQDAQACPQTAATRLGVDVCTTFAQGELSVEVPFYLARHRAQVPGDAQLAFEEDLRAVFSALPS